MPPLIVATSATRAGVVDAIRAGAHQRLDYATLAERLGTTYVDYGQVHAAAITRRFAVRSRLDVHQALHVARQIRAGHIGSVLSLSERVGIPLTPLVGRNVTQIVMGHHLLSPTKLRLLTALGILDRWEAIIVLTTAEAETLRDTLHRAGDSIHVCYPPIDTMFFRSSAEVPATDAPPHILSVGLSHRDYPTLIAALRRLPRITAHIRAGSSWVHHAAGYEREPIPPNMEIKPAVSPDALRACYRASRFVVVPIAETTQWSAGANAVLEAQAMGKAVIATRTPGMMEYVRDGETGILVAGSDPAAMADAVEYLWNEPGRAAAMGERGRAWIARRFSFDQWLDDICDFLIRVGQPAQRSVVSRV